MDPPWAKDIRPSGNFESHLDGLKQDVKAGRKHFSTYKKIPAAKDIPLDIRNRPLHPDNPADTDWAIILLHNFEMGGLAGLGEAIRYQADLHQKDDRVTPKKNYEVINEQNLIHFIMMTASMYPEFIVGLISGDVFSRYAEKEEVRSAMNLYHVLKKTSGNYLQAFVQTETVPLETPTNMTTATQANLRVRNEHKFKGVTFAQLHDLYEVTLQYLPSSPDLDMTVVHAIDSMYAGSAKDIDYPTGKHKYAKKAVKGSPGNEKKFEQWLAELKKNYIDRIEGIMAKDPNDPILHIPMKVSFLEIGWGKDIKQRSSSHDDHRSSNSLFTYFQAAVKYIIDNDRTRPPPFQIIRCATNLLNRGDNLDDAYLDGTIGDVAMTMLGRSEWFKAGLNPQPGGGAGIQKNSLPEMLPYIQEQGDKTYNRTGSRFQLNVVQSCEKLKEMKEVYEITDQEFQRREKVVEDGKKAREARWKKIEFAMSKLEEMNVLRLGRKVVEADRQSTTQLSQQSAAPVSRQPVVPLAQRSTASSSQTGTDRRFTVGAGGIVSFKAVAGNQFAGRSKVRDQSAMLKLPSLAEKGDEDTIME